jgi:phosphate:Na+ symporter
MTIFNLLTLLGGLAIFLFGMDVMGKALERQAGGKLQSMLNRMTSSPLTGFLLGLGVTAVIQSSSATTVMLVGFVNSGIMQLRQAIPVIMGSNVGTTVTAWILSLTGIDGESIFIQLLKPSSFTPILALIGIVLCMFCKSDKKKGIGTIMLGFAVLMFGMETMSGAMEPLKDEAWFTSLFLKFSNPILGVLVGTLLTAIIQSSSASVGILQALSATGIVTYASAVPIIMGQNIGTCVTALISSVGANKDAKRVAMVHLYFNIIGVVLFLCLFYGINAIVPWGFLNESASELGIAVVHTTFNVVATGVLLPFNRVLEKLAIMTVRDKKSAGVQNAVLDERLFASPGVAAERARAVACDMFEMSRTMLVNALDVTEKWDASKAKLAEECEMHVDQYEDMLGTYLVKLSAYQLNHSDNCTVNTLLHVIGDFERIGDHALNLLKTAQEIEDKKINFSSQAQEELRVLRKAVSDIVDRTEKAFVNRDLALAGKVEPQEQVIDGLVREVKKRHVERLRAGSCTIEYGFVLNDLLTNFERIADHCSNIAVEMIQVSEDTYNTHKFLGELKAGTSEASGDFERRYERYRERYAFPDGDEDNSVKDDKKE